MKKIVLAVSALALASVASFAVGAQASTAQSKTVSGYCVSGASYTLLLSRAGDKVSTTLTVKGLPKSAIWNVNYAYTGVNVVKNVAAQSSKTGTLTLKDSVVAPNQLAAYIWVDSWGPVSVGYCYTGGVI
jgi:ABC-type oligopeptide transport system substrate-binding subunit